ncbi:Lin1244/Lin1753 domain-containing protein [Chishuiella changwenlii]|uniref:Lin1244/Lin1753 domain-containing protein n=1 Tax=Chishuiella changwenlii TaxID=1434701 RepID=UPI002FD93B13
MASKNTFYFSHDGGARNDDKMIAVRMKHKAEGYAVYFMILEKMLESSDYTIFKDYNVLAFDFRVGSDLVKSIVEDFGLFEFTDDNKSFYSKSFQSRMEPLENLRKQRREAGLKSAEKRANSTKNQQNSTVVERSLPKNPTKESKVNNNTNVLLEKNKQKKEIEISNFEETPNSTSFKNFQEEKEKSSAKKEKELEGVKNFLVENGADYTDVSEWFKKRIEEKKATTRYFAEKFTLECKKSNITVKDAVYACAFNGWINFNPQWVLNQQKTNSKTSKNGIKESKSDDIIVGRVNVTKTESYLESRRKQREMESSGNFETNL